MSTQKDFNNDDIKGLGILFGIQTLISVVTLLLFTLLLRPNNRLIYEPRSKFAAENKKPVPLAKSRLAWLLTVSKIEPLKSLEKIGLDAIMFLQFIKFARNMIIFQTAFALATILFNFFNVIGSNTPVESLEAPSLSKFDINHFNPTLLSEFTYYHFYASILWVFSIYFYVFSYRLWTTYANLRHQWFQSRDFNDAHHNRTLIVTEIKPELQNKVALQKYFTDLKIGNSLPKQIIIGMETGALDELVKEHDKFTLKLEKALLSYYKSKEKKRPSKSGVDTIDFCSKKIISLEKQVYELRLTGEEKMKTNSSAFVSFETPFACHSVARILESPLISGPNVKLCPNYDDIHWENIGRSMAAASSKRILSFVLFAGVTAGYSFLNVIISAIISTKTIGKISPGLQTIIEKNSSLSFFFANLLAPILMIVINLILPLFLRYLSVMQGVKSIGGVQKSVLRKYFYFLIYQFLLQSIFKIIFALIAEAITPTAQTQKKSNEDTLNRFYVVFFKPTTIAFLSLSTPYIILTCQNLVGTTLEIAQGYPLIAKWFQRKFFSLTPRQEMEVNHPPILQFEIMYGLLLNSFFTVMSYSVVSPLIVPFGLVSFSLAYVVYKYQLFYVYETKAETGGTYWPQVFDYLIFSLSFAQLATSSVLAINCWYVRPKGSSTFIYGDRTSAVFAFCSLIPSLLFWLYIRFKVAPLCRYVPHEFRISHDDDSLILADELFNPVLAKPLKKVWVPTAMKATLHEFHQTEYADLNDYIQKTRHSLQGVDQNIARRAEISNKAEQFQRKTTLKRMSLTGNNLDVGGEFEQFADYRDQQQYTNYENGVQKSQSNQNLLCIDEYGNEQNSVGYHHQIVIGAPGYPPQQQPVQYAPQQGMYQQQQPVQYVPQQQHPQVLYQQQPIQQQFDQNGRPIVFVAQVVQGQPQVDQYGRPVFVQRNMPSRSRAGSAADLKF